MKYIITKHVKRKIPSFTYLALRTNLGQNLLAFRGTKIWGEIDEKTEKPLAGLL